MFGYVAPLKCELKMRDWTLYQAYYCGLCHTLRTRYGQLPRLVLDYDCTFLGILLSGILGANPCELQRCGYKPLHKKRPVAPGSPALDYAADVNVLLAWYQCADDWNDEHKPLALVGRTALQSAVKKAKAFQPETANCIERSIAALSQLERERTTSIDAVADTFAQLLKDVFLLAPELAPRERSAVGWLGYHLGRWIYLADAWEDRAKDAQHHSFNPFHTIKADQQRAAFLLSISLSEAEKAYDLIDLKCNQGILDNIMYQGCRHKTRLLLEGDEG